MIVCVDYKRQDGKWQKAWEELGIPPGNICTAEEAFQQDRDWRSTDLVLLHRSLDNFELRLGDWIKKLGENFAGIVGVVSAGGNPPVDTVANDGVHYFRTEFPSVPRGLKHLSPRFHELADRLQNAANRNDKLTACRQFDASTQDIGLLMALAILCQGYLVARAGFDATAWNSNATSAALKKIGWLVDSPQGLVVNPDMEGTAAMLSPEPRDAAAWTDYWRSALTCGVAAEEDTTSRWISMLRREWGNEMPEDVTQLLGEIETTSAPLVETVAKAYGAIHTRLGQVS